MVALQAVQAMAEVQAVQPELHAVHTPLLLNVANGQVVTAP